MRALQRSATATLLLVTASAPAAAQLPNVPSADNPQALAGLDGVLVQIDLDEQSARTLEASDDEVARRVDARLRAAGIRNLAREQSVRQGAAVYRVRLTSTEGAAQAPVLVLESAVREPVLLARDASRVHMATTWQPPATALRPTAAKPPAAKPPTTEPHADALAAALDRHLTAFAAAYAKANPKKP